QAYLIPSMMVSRGINFYFLLIVSLGVVLVNRFVLDRRRTPVRNKVLSDNKKTVPENKKTGV
ncbi:MAG TPA: hypothetical protein H9909_04110, partial [Candidatus Mediterraneibacter norfolkensis]|nr:hypothetical protein [Candidatus Mediterraneibacter norfolkensis]